LIKKYFWYLLAIGCFWEVSLEASQVALYFAKEQLGYSNTAASILLVYSSIGAIA
jgi:hypothetical protein